MKRIAVALIMVSCLFAQKPPKPPKPGLYANFKTDLGDFRAVLYEKDTPIAVGVFAGLAQGTQSWRDPSGAVVKQPYYDGTTFFRIIHETAVQAGSPTGQNNYNCGFTIKDEILPGLKFKPGAMAIANAGPNTGSCQFFINLASSNPGWDGQYTIFGQVVEGLDVVEKMAKVPLNGETPVTAPKLISVTLERVGPAPVIKKPKN